MNEQTGGIQKALNNCRVTKDWMQNLPASEVTIMRPLGLTSLFDASLREILKLVARGYSKEWPHAFG